MVLPGSASITMRCMTRAAVASKNLTTQRQIATNLMAVRSLSSIGSSSVGIQPNSTRSSIVAESSSVAALGCSLSQLALRTTTPVRSQQSNLFSSLAPNTKQQPLGEPVTYLSLNNLADNPGAIKKKRRVGRGIGSSKGKTCGRGHKGQKARAGGGVHPTFEGGQTRFFKRLPKIGKMKNHKFKLELIPLNVGTVQDYITMGRLMPERADGVLTMKDFVNAGMFPHSSIKSGVKLLGDGKEFLKDKIHIEVPWASKTAIEAIESKGGFVTTVHYNKLALRALLKPHKFPLKPETMLAEEGDGDDGAGAELDAGDMHLLPKRARPPPKYMPYYTDYAKRGYLNPKVQLERAKRGLKDIL